MNFQTKKDENQARRYLAVALERICKETKNKCDSLKGIQEPDLIACLSREFIDDIHSALKAYCPHMLFSVAGSFCHQKPLANYKGPKSPEVGDLLIVYFEHRKASAKICNALLLQAKSHDGDSYRINRNEQHQLKLYREWPEFTYERAGDLNGLSRDVTPKTISQGAQYLMMRKPFDNEKCFRIAMPDDRIIPHNSFIDEFLRLMKFSSGRTFDNIDNIQDDWSQMIWDLLNCGRNSKFSRRNIKIVNMDRHAARGNFDFFLPSQNDRDINDLDLGTDDISSTSIIVVEGVVSDSYEDLRQTRIDEIGNT